MSDLKKGGDGLEGEDLENKNESVETLKSQKTGEVYESLARSNSQIRKERGDSIAEDLEIVFKRDVEDIRLDIKRKERDRKNMYDFSPNSTTSLVLATSVNSREILLKDKELSYELRELRIKLEIAETRYRELFGKDA